MHRLLSGCSPIAAVNCSQYSTSALELLLLLQKHYLITVVQYAFADFVAVRAYVDIGV